jgi:hypothetical protein
MKRETRAPPCRWPGTLPHPRSVRCDSPLADSRCNSTSTPCPGLSLPTAPRDRSSIHVSHSSAAPRKSSPWDCPDRRAAAAFYLSVENFRPCPGFQQCPVGREMLVAGQPVRPRLLHHMRQKLLVTSASSKRSRFLLNTVASHTSSSKFNPTNPRNSML